MEADLSRYHQIDLRDLFRRDPHGRRHLTLRMVWVRVKHLPPDSATAVALGRPGWTRSHYLLADIVHASTGKPYPGRPTDRHGTADGDAVRLEKLRAARRRARDRQAAIARGDIT